VTNSAVRIFEISNRMTPVFDSMRNEHNYSKFPNTYHHQFLTYLTEWRRFVTLATTPSNQQNQQTWSRLHRQCHLKTLTSTYYWGLLRPTITIRFDSKFQIIAQLFDSIWFEMKKHYCTALVMKITLNDCALKLPEASTKGIRSRETTPQNITPKTELLLCWMCYLCREVPIQCTTPILDMSLLGRCSAATRLD